MLCHRFVILRLLLLAISARVFPCCVPSSQCTVGVTSTLQPCPVSCCVPSSQVTLGVTSMLQPCPVSCCVPGSQGTLGVTSTLLPCPVSLCSGQLLSFLQQQAHGSERTPPPVSGRLDPASMPATILLLAAGLVSWTGIVVPSLASCRLLIFVTILLQLYS